MSETNQDYREMRDAFNALGVEIGKLLKAVEEDGESRIGESLAILALIDERFDRMEQKRIERKLKKRKKDRK